MTELGKVIKGLEDSLENWGCGYMDGVGELYAVSGEDLQNAIALLKYQEAVEPRRIDGKRNRFIKCGNCNYDLLTAFQFCPHCGRSVKWE